MKVCLNYWWKSITDWYAIGAIGSSHWSLSSILHNQFFKQFEIIYKLKCKTLLRRGWCWVSIWGRPYKIQDDVLIKKNYIILNNVILRSRWVSIR